MNAYICMSDSLAISLKNKEENYAHGVGNIVQWVRCLLLKYQKLNVDPQHPRTKAGLGSALLWPQHWWVGTEEFWTLTISQSSQNLKLSRLWVPWQTLAQTKERVAGEEDTWMTQPPAAMWEHTWEHLLKHATHISLTHTQCMHTRMHTRTHMHAHALTVTWWLPQCPLKSS